MLNKFTGHIPKFGDTFLWVICNVQNAWRFNFQRNIYTSSAAPHVCVENSTNCSTNGEEIIFTCPKVWELSRTGRSHSCCWIYIIFYMEWLHDAMARGTHLGHLKLYEMSEIWIRICSRPINKRGNGMQPSDVGSTWPTHDGNNSQWNWITCDGSDR